MNSNFKRPPQDGDWVYLDHDSNNPRKIGGKGQLNLMHLFSPIPLTAEVMGWIEEAKKIHDMRIDININEYISFAYDPKGVLILTNDGATRLHSITYLHELQQLSRLLSGGKELTIVPPTQKHNDGEGTGSKV